MVKYGRKNTTGSYYSRYSRRKYFKKSLGRAKTYQKVVAVSKYLKTNMQNVKCTFNDTVYLAPGLNVYKILSTINDYVNIVSMLAGSLEFVSRKDQYSFFKVNGIAFIFTRKFLDPISYGVDGVSKGFTQATYGLGLEDMSCNFYPAYASAAAVGIRVENAESSWKVAPYSWNKQRHYIPFYSNFVKSAQGGYGTWNSCNDYTGMLGQLSIYNSGECCSASTSGGIYIWDMEVEVYVSFCNSNGA